MAMPILWAVLLLLGSYFSVVLPSAVGAPKHPLFFLPASWRGESTSEEQVAKSRKDISEMMEKEAPDVRRERDRAERWAKTDNATKWCLSAASRLIVCNSISLFILLLTFLFGVVYSEGTESNRDKPFVRIYNARKDFSGFIANKGLSIALMKGKCFGLLGPNGSGENVCLYPLFFFKKKKT